MSAHFSHERERKRERECEQKRSKGGIQQQTSTSKFEKVREFFLKIEYSFLRPYHFQMGIKVNANVHFIPDRALKGELEPECKLEFELEHNREREQASKQDRGSL